MLQRLGRRTESIADGAQIIFSRRQSGGNTCRYSYRYVGNRLSSRSACSRALSCPARHIARFPQQLRCSRQREAIVSQLFFLRVHNPRVPCGSPDAMCAASIRFSQGNNVAQQVFAGRSGNAQHTKALQHRQAGRGSCPSQTNFSPPCSCHMGASATCQVRLRFISHRPAVDIQRNFATRRYYAGGEIGGHSFMSDIYWRVKKRPSVSE